MKIRNLTVLILAVIVLVGGAFMYIKRDTLFGSYGTIKDSGANISDYSAVFLTNGQVYFGKITSISSDQIDLRDIFYLQVNQALQPDNNTKATPSPSPSPDIQLIKLGNELHGPNDRMLINRNQVIFTESLKNDSKVVKAILDFKSKQ